MVIKMTKEEKTALFNENKKLLDHIVRVFISKHPTFSYLKEDMRAESYKDSLTVIEKFDSTKGTKLSTYLFQQITFKLQKYLRKFTRMSQGDELMGDLLNQIDNSALTTFRLREFEDILTDAKVTDNQRNILELSILEDLTLSQIAEEEGVSQPAITKTLKRAKVRIRKSLQRGL